MLKTAIPTDLTPSPEDPTIKGSGSRPKGDLRKEYVAGGPFMVTAPYRTLSWSVDDLEQDFGDDIYDRMRHDPQIESTVELLRLASIAQGIYLVPPQRDEKSLESEEGPKPSDPEAEKAKEIAIFCKQVLDNMDGDFASNTIYDLLDGILYGSRVGELIYHVPEHGPLKDKLVLKDIKIKPRRSLAFVVDRFMNIIGILGRLPTQPATFMMGSIESLDQVPNLLPREKFIVFSFRPRDEDPRGTSIARPAYNAWWLKMQTWPEYLKFITQFAGPSIVGTTAEGAEASPALDPLTGEPVINPETGTILFIEPEEAMKSALENFRNGSVIAVPFGASVKTLDVQHIGSPFTDAIELFDRQMAKAILSQTLATEEGRYQARAAAQTHQDVLGLVVQNLKAIVASVIKQDVLRPLVLYNFGPDLVYLTPDVNLTQTEQHDFAVNAQAVASLQKSGYLHPSQLPQVDSMIGLPPRGPEAIQPTDQNQNQNQNQGQGQGQGQEQKPNERQNPPPNN